MIRARFGLRRRELRLKVPAAGVDVVELAVVDGGAAPGLMAASWGVHDGAFVAIQVIDLAFQTFGGGRAAFVALLVACLQARSAAAESSGRCAVVRTARVTQSSARCAFGAPLAPAVMRAGVVRPVFCFDPATTARTRGRPPGRPRT
jgi:hypothetical protein